MVHAIDEMAGGWEWIVAARRMVAAGVVRNLSLNCVFHVGGNGGEWRCRFADGLIGGSLPATSIAYIYLIIPPHDKCAIGVVVTLIPSKD